MIGSPWERSGINSILFLKACSIINNYNTNYFTTSNLFVCKICKEMLVNMFKKYIFYKDWKEFDSLQCIISPVIKMNLIKD